jgi:hypothetical protein
MSAYRVFVWSPEFASFVEVVFGASLTDAEWLAARMQGQGFDSYIIGW